MSSHLQNQGWAVRLPALQKIVHQNLCHRAVLSTGESVASVRDIADACGMSDSSVRESIKALEAAGHVESTAIRRGVTRYVVKVGARP
ncbi:helix-turn-helix domain-containing protein [Pandoraea aquatica]|uniref:Helix-turn-helix domain-containing protein n=1 Tax=Pandoraea aquatica TaxID=2508290 RepID=A0A5E4SLS7_9BURK|nr:helix-turn-helix domain-containing protein [Pandoraea aquatica]VVD74839.1 helix-turn-helix domain-containing protein [Pandoraea aquatica]